MKILFFGTPLFAEIVLNKLLKSKHRVVGVVCQSDKPAGRGNKMTSPAIKNMANLHNIPVYQFEKILPHIEDFKNIDCDIFVTASYGKILPKALLDIKPCINVHPSLLPKYRGATPIQNALLNGDSVTGVTVMKTEVGMDDGDIFTQEKFEILPEEDYTSLLPKLAELGGKLLLQTLDKFENNTAKRTPQNAAEATFVKLLKKEDGLLDFSLPAQNLVNKVRAFVEFPVAFFEIGGQIIKVYKAAVAEDEFAKNLQGQAGGKAGVVLCTKKRFLISTGSGVFEILRCQAQGGKILDASAFLNGFHFKSMVVGE